MYDSRIAKQPYIVAEPEVSPRDRTDARARASLGSTEVQATDEQSAQNAQVTASIREDTHSAALMDQDFPPQLNATVGGELHGYEYSPCSWSKTFEPCTRLQNAFAALGGAVMIVLPESMIVSNLLEETLWPLTDTEAPPICQKPSLLDSRWNSMSPVNRSSFVPPMNSSEPVCDNLKEKTPSGAVPCETAVKKNGFCGQATLLSMLLETSSRSGSSSTHMAEIRDRGQSQSEKAVGRI